MNKKIESEIAIGILVIVAVVIGFVFVEKAQAPAAQPIAEMPVTQTQPATQQNVTATSPAAPTAQSVPANEKTFTSSTNKVSFNYASLDTVSENENTITITGITGTAAANGTDDTISLVINVFNNPTKKGLEDWFKSTFNKAADKDCTANDSNLTFGTYQSVLFDASIVQSCDDRGYYAISQDNSTVAKFDLGQDPIADLDEIQSTFKFTK